MVIAINMLGWTLPKLRLPTLVCQMLTLACWVGFGVVKGWWGFCPLTYWHWQLLESMGAIGLPNNYITYIAKQWLGLRMSNDFSAGLVLGCFSMAVLTNILLLRKKI